MSITGLGTSLRFETPISLSGTHNRELQKRRLLAKSLFLSLSPARYSTWRFPYTWSSPPLPGVTLAGRGCFMLLKIFIAILTNKSSVRNNFIGKLGSKSK